MAYMLSKIILFGGLVASLGVGGFNAKQQQEENHQFRLENHKSVVYNDNQYEITLTADDMNDNEFTHLLSYVNDTLTSTSTTTIGSGFTYSTYTGSGVSLSYSGGDNPYRSIVVKVQNGPNPDFQLMFNNNNDGLWTIQYPNSGLPQNDLTLVFSSDYYNGFKSAIEEDIQANTQGNMPSASDLFAQITAGVTGFVGSLGQAFTSVVALFWDSTNSAPTFIGLLMLLAIGAGLIYLAIRFVMGLVRRLRG